MVEMMALKMVGMLVHASVDLKAQMMDEQME